MDVAAVFVVFVGAERAEHSRFHDFRETDDRVERCTQLVAHIGEEFRLGGVGFLGAIFFVGVFDGEIGQRLTRIFQVIDGGDQPLFALHQFFFVALDRCDVGADRDIAAVFGAAFADMQPAAVFELCLEGLGAGNRAAAARDTAAHQRLAAGIDDGFVSRADVDRFVGEVVQFLEVRIAQHQPIVGVPQHERFWDCFDGIAQPQVRRDGALDQMLLFGDIDGDADQMRPGIPRLMGQFAARAQPHPMAVGMAHAERVIDGAGFRFRQVRGEFVQPHVVRVNQRGDLAEGQQFVLGGQSEDCKHRMRPENPAAREIPVPQAAAAAIERRVDAAANGVVDAVCLARARRLPMKRKAKDQHHESGGGRERDRQRGQRAPGLQGVAMRLHKRKLTA